MMRFLVALLALAIELHGATFTALAQAQPHSTFVSAISAVAGFPGMVLVPPSGTTLFDGPVLHEATIKFDDYRVPRVPNYDLASLTIFTLDRTPTLHSSAACWAPSSQLASDA